jgi:putative oxygen-independent coproporphyrinogen III oxidase
MSLGLYLHIPFCARRCPYCDFAVHIGPALHGKYLQALQTELVSTLSAHFSARPHDQIGTIFCGGGTPTSVGAGALNDLLQIIRDHAPVAKDAEVTLEGNPEDASPALFDELRAGGWNRVSLGVQSLDDGVLQVLGRRHTRAQVESSVRAACGAGWENINLDLIYAVPGQSLESWHETLSKAVQMGVPHLSCYSLTIEDGTAFARRVSRGRMAAVPDDTQAEFMEAAQQVLEGGGIERYEVSNYARRGMECRHNLHTWRGGSYLACGNGAHGHLDGHRWWNTRSVSEYIALIKGGNPAREGKERVSPTQRLEERVMLGLRLREGFDLDEIGRECGLDAQELLEPALSRMIESGVLEPAEAVAPESQERSDSLLENALEGEHFSGAAVAAARGRRVSSTSTPGTSAYRLRLSPQSWAVADAVALELLRDV